MAHAAREHVSLHLVTEVSLPYSDLVACFAVPPAQPVHAHGRRGQAYEYSRFMWEPLLSGRATG